MNAKEWLYNKYIAESINIEELHTFSGEFLLRAIEEYYQYKLSEITEEKIDDAFWEWFYSKDSFGDGQREAWHRSIDWLLNLSKEKD